jgi:hypothetical protein
MSKRHRDSEVVLPPWAERRAHARSERHRVATELADVAEQVSGGVEPDDAPDPGVGYRPLRHHDSAHAKRTVAGPRRRRHWKLKMWKRRTSVRVMKAKAQRIADEV